MPLRLTGTNDLGSIAPETTTTAADGSYSFGDLRPGTYTVTQTAQPKGYTPGLTTRGDVTPIAGSDLTHAVPGIGVTEDETTPNNDFGELVVVPPPGGQTTTPCVMTPPTIQNVQRFGLHEFPTSFVLTFNEKLDPASATNLANYKLVVAFRDGRLARRDIPLKSAVYNATNDTVTLTPVSEHLNIHYHYQLTVSGVTDTCGDVLNGNGTGAGTPFVTIVTKNNYAGVTPAGPAAAANNAAWSNRYPRLAAERAGVLNAKRL